MAVLCGGDHLIPVAWQRLASPRAAIGFLHVVPLRPPPVKVRRQPGWRWSGRGARKRLRERKRTRRIVEHPSS